MISSLRGLLVHKDAQQAVVECGGVGYGVSMSLAALERLGALGSEVHLVIHTHVSQDALRLYGFLDLAERRTFEILIATSGVGPKLALSILSVFGPAELAEVVSRADRAALTRIPGIGAKTAERLLVELKHRLPDLHVEPAAAGRGALQGDLESALVNLGYKPQAAEAAARLALEEHPAESDLASLVRHALRSSTRP